MLLRLLFFQAMMIIHFVYCLIDLYYDVLPVIAGVVFNNCFLQKPLF